MSTLRNVRSTAGPLAASCANDSAVRITRVAVERGITSASRAALLATRSGLRIRSDAARMNSISRAGLVRLPAVLGDLELEALRVRVEDHGADVDRRHPVHERVVGLVDVGVAAAAEPLDEVQLPERPSKVQRLGHQPSDQLAQLGVVARAWQRDAPHVPLEIEARVIGPDRVVEAERRARHALAETRDEVEPLVDMGEQLVERRGFPDDDDRRAHVHVDGSSLGQKRGHVGGREPVAHSGGLASAPPAMYSSRLSRAPERIFFWIAGVQPKRSPTGPSA